MENGENKDLQGRREFFKEAAKKAMPVIGAMVLASNPIIEHAAASTPMNCEGSSCSNLCYRGCKNDCEVTCDITCSHSCRGTCKGNCKGDCMGSCYNSCAGSTR